MNLVYVTQNQTITPSGQSITPEMEEIFRSAQQRAEWSWSDIMIAFKEIGYDPSSNEKERIVNTIAQKKARSMLIKAGY